MAKGFTLLTVFVAVQLVAGQYRTSTRRDGFALPDNLPRRRPLPEEYLLDEEPVRSRAQDDEAVRRRQPQTRRQLPAEELLDDPRVSRRRTPVAAAPLPVELPPAPGSQRRSDGSRQSRRQRTRGSGRRRQRPQFQDDALEDAQDDTQALPPQRQVDNTFALDPRLLRQPLVAESPSPGDPGQPLSVDQILGRDALTLDPPQGQLQPLDVAAPQRPTEPPARRATLPVDLPPHGGQSLPADPVSTRAQFQPVDFQAHPRHSLPADPPAAARRPADPRLQRPQAVDPLPRRQAPAVDAASSRRQLPAEPPRRQPDPPAPRRPPPPPPQAAPTQPRRQPASTHHQRPPPAANVPLPQVDRQCGKPNGFFPDELQCDRYYECRSGVATEGLCPDGLVFNTAGGSRYLNCDSPRVVDCTGRADLQPAQPNGNCPRRYGMFAHDSDCTRFWNCLDGHGTEIKCPEGLVYNEEKATCDWPDNVPKCKVEEHLDFSCPDSPEGGARTGVYERYAHPTDCRLHYVCIPGKDGVNRPRLQSCPDRLVFDNIGGFCELPRNVQGCEEYYGDSDDPPREEVRPATDVQTARRRTRSETQE